MSRRLFAIAALFLAGCSAGENPRVVMVTNKGTVNIELYESKAPGTVKNFLQYVDDKFYDGKIFHRVISNFMIQGGGMEPGLIEAKTRGSINNESGNGLKNERGTLAMARTPKPHSASSQFFINVKDNDFLDKANAQDGWGYCVFGKVLDDGSMKVVDAIRRVPTRDDVPIEDVIIESIRRVPTK